MINKKDLPEDELQDRLDQTIFRLNDDQMQNFLSILEEPAVANPMIAKLLSIPTPWEKLKDK